MKLFLCAVLLSGSVPAAAECLRPAVPALPEGDTSNLQAMVDGQRAVREYLAAAELHLECLLEQERAAGEDVDSEPAMRRMEIYNAAVEEMERVAADFNEEIRAYRARNR